MSGAQSSQASRTSQAPETPRATPPQTPHTSPALIRVLRVAEPILLVLVPIVLIACAYTQAEYTALLSLAVVIVAVVPFFARFEIERMKPRDIMPIVVLAAVAAAGRIVFAPFPSVKPVAAIVIVAGLCFGRQSGFLVGALAALVSNMFFGQGPWTPWQMYAWGLMGYGAGMLAEHAFSDKPSLIYIYGFVSCLAFGLIMDSYYIVGFISPLTWGAAWTAYGLGLPFSLMQAVATVIFLVPILVPWRKSIARVRRKYGILRNVGQQSEG